MIDAGGSPTALTAPYYRVELRPWEYSMAALIGAERTGRNFGRRDAPSYRDDSRKQDDRTAQHAAAAAECAVARLLNEYWTAGGAWPGDRHGEFSGLPDVGCDKEVRRVRDGGSRTFAVQAKDDQPVIVACFVEPPELRVVRVLGWIRLSEARDTWIKSSSGRVPIGALVTHGYRTTEELTTAQQAASATAI